MKILFISTLYPSSVHPTQAPFNRQLFGALAKQIEDGVYKKVGKDGKKDCINTSASQENLRNGSHLWASVGSNSLSSFLRVVAPVYWMPGRKLPPKSEIHDGVAVTHPKVFYTPGVFRAKHGAMYRWSVRKHLRNVIDEFKPDHVVIGFAYPDAVAVAPLCREWGIDYSIRVNGSDFRLRVKQDGFRKMVLDEMNRAPRIFCPGKALKRDMAAEGIDEAKITSFNNGVKRVNYETRKIHENTEIHDNELSSDFCKVCHKGEKTKKVVLFVGHLIAVKGPDVMLEAWKLLTALPVKESPHLVFIGDGGMRKSLEQRAADDGLQGRVTFLGDVPHEQVFAWMRKADCLCLTSKSEGMPNVVVEALACGLPVVATDVGEVPFLVEDDVNGYVVEKAETSDSLPKDIAEAVNKTLDKKWDHELIAERMKDYTWGNVADTVLATLRE